MKIRSGRNWKNNDKIRESILQMLNKWCHLGGNSINVCIFGFAHFKFKQKRTMGLFTTLLLHFTLNNLNKKNITRIIDLIKYPIPDYFLFLSHILLQHAILITRKGFISILLGQENTCIGIDSTNKGLKYPCCITVSNHAGIGGRCDASFPGRDSKVWRGC